MIVQDNAYAKSLIEVVRDVIKEQQIPFNHSPYFILNKEPLSPVANLFKSDLLNFNCSWHMLLNLLIHLIDVVIALNWLSTPPQQMASSRQLRGCKGSLSLIEWLVSLKQVKRFLSPLPLKHLCSSRIAIHIFKQRLPLFIHIPSIYSFLSPL